MLLVQLGINSTSDVWEFCQNWTSRQNGDKTCACDLQRLGGYKPYMLLNKHLSLSIMLWFSHILTIAALCGSQLYISATLSNRLQTLQKRAARVILGYRKEQGQSEAALNDLQWKTLKKRTDFLCRYKNFHAQARAILTEAFENPFIPQHKTTITCISQT